MPKSLPARCRADDVGSILLSSRTGEDAARGYGPESEYPAIRGSRVSHCGKQWSNRATSDDGADTAAVWRAFAWEATRLGVLAGFIDVIFFEDASGIAPNAIGAVGAASMMA